MIPCVLTSNMWNYWLLGIQCFLGALLGLGISLFGTIYLVSRLERILRYKEMLRQMREEKQQSSITMHETVASVIKKKHRRTLTVKQPCVRRSKRVKRQTLRYGYNVT